LPRHCRNGCLQDLGQYVSGLHLRRVRRQQHEGVGNDARHVVTEAQQAVWQYRKHQRQQLRA